MEVLLLADGCLWFPYNFATVYSTSESIYLAPMTTSGIVSDASDDEYIIPSNSKRLKLEKAGDEAANSEVAASSHYLETINLDHLNFDYDKTCLVTLSDVNTYCCLCCGKYFQGRSKQLPAYLHSVNSDHHVYINMESLKVYTLPENREICSVSSRNESSGIKIVDRIRYAIDPKYSTKDIGTMIPVSLTVDGKRYLTGFIGLSSISGNNLINVVLQIFSHITPIRDYFLVEKDNVNGDGELSKKLGLIIRKMWSAKLFRSHVSAHEFVQALEKDKTYTSVMEKMLKSRKAVSPDKFLDLVLIVLDKQSPKKSKSVFSKTFQGKVQVTSTPLVSQADAQSNVEKVIPDFEAKRVTTSKFWNLTLDLPQYNVAGSETTEIPQVKLESLLAKYDGQSTKTIVSDTRGSLLVSYKLVKLPQYLVFSIDRNADSVSISNKGKYNPTVVTFPLSLDMSPYINGEGSEGSMMYDLVSNVKRNLSNITEENTSDIHEWTVRLQKSDTEWVAISDLSVEPAERELMFLDENHLMVWKKRST